jgi:hypothetical protein
MQFFGRTEAARIGDDICHKSIFSSEKVIQLHSMMLL